MMMMRTAARQAARYIHQTPLRRYLSSSITIQDLEMNVADLHTDDSLERAKHIYDQFGCLIVRGLNEQYVANISQHADAIFQQSLKLLENGQAKEHINEASGLRLGWLTPDQTLWIPAQPDDTGRDKQVMILGLDYFNSSALFDAATDSKTLDLVQLFLNDENIELFSKGQTFYKEGSVGKLKRASNPKLLHQVRLIFFDFFLPFFSPHFFLIFSLFFF